LLNRGEKAGPQGGEKKAPPRKKTLEQPHPKKKTTTPDQFRDWETRGLVVKNPPREIFIEGVRMHKENPRKRGPRDARKERKDSQ